MKEKRRVEKRGMVRIMIKRRGKKATKLCWTGRTKEEGEQREGRRKIDEREKINERKGEL